MSVTGPAVVQLGGMGGKGAGAVRPFLVGTAVGSEAGAVAGTLLSVRTRRLLVGMIQLIDRRLTRSERERLRFELLLQ